MSGTRPAIAWNWPRRRFGLSLRTFQTQRLDADGRERRISRARQTTSLRVRARQKLWKWLQAIHAARRQVECFPSRCGNGTFGFSNDALECGPGSGWWIGGGAFGAGEVVPQLLVSTLRFRAATRP